MAGHVEFLNSTSQTIYITGDDFIRELKASESVKLCQGTTYSVIIGDSDVSELPFAMFRGDPFKNICTNPSFQIRASMSARVFTLVTVTL